MVKAYHDSADLLSQHSVDNSCRSMSSNQARSIEQGPGQPNIGRKLSKQKASENVYEVGGHFLSLASSRTW